MVAQYFAQIDENNVVINVHVVTAEFMAANPERQALATHTTTTHKILRHHHRSSQ
jgi:hypothetical protein